MIMTMHEPVLYRLEGSTAWIIAVVHGRRLEGGYHAHALLGYARLTAKAWPDDPALWGQHFVCRGPHGRGDPDHSRLRQWGLWAGPGPPGGGLRPAPRAPVY